MISYWTLLQTKSIIRDKTKDYLLESQDSKILINFALNPNSKQKYLQNLLTSSPFPLIVVHWIDQDILIIISAYTVPRKLEFK